MKNLGLTVFFCCGVSLAISQNTPPDFTLPASVCLNQNILIKNFSVNATNYQWDFCAGDLDQTPTASIISSSAKSPSKIEFVEQGGLYYGFYASQSTGKIIRLDFGNSINNTPAMVDLGGLGVNSTSWFTIKIVNDSGVYYGFIIDFSNKIFRINFGASLTNIPSNAEVLYQDNLLASPLDLALVEDGSAKYIFATNYANNNLVRFAFNNSFGDPSNSVSVTNVPVTGSGGISGISFIKDYDTWYAVSTSFGANQIFKITFNAGLNDVDPTISSLLSGLPFAPQAPLGVSLAFDNNKFYAFIQSVQSTSNLYKIDFGNTMSNPPTNNSSDLGNLGVLSNVWGFSMYKVRSNWLVLSSENSGQRIFRITFPNSCFSTSDYSTVQSNFLTSASTGTYFVTLTTLNSQGYFTSNSKQINITIDQSPDIRFTFQNICVNNNVLFATINQSGNISSYQWDFDDGTTDLIDANPSHTYSYSSVYYPSLTVTASNGCQNFAQDTLQIFNPPQANFNLPVASPLCSNQSYVLTNTTTSDPGSNPTWQWSVNGTNVSSTQNLNYLFTSSASQNVSLTASIPGCSTSSTQNITNLVDGPLVSFNSSPSVCAGTTISFTNTTGGSATSTVWLYGDGNTSAVPSGGNGANIYSSSGLYPVTLNVSNAAGCQNSYSKNVIVYSVPQPAFAIEAAPSSCTNWPSQFDNNTPPLTDSNISSWSWDFGDGTNPSSLPSPTHVFTQSGMFNVKLKATSDFGCTNSISSPVPIVQSPSAGFKDSVFCVGISKQFTDASVGNIVKWDWGIQGNSNHLSGQGPFYKFNTNGNYNVTLTVTDNNKCVNQITKPILVPIKPVIDFIIQRPCTGHPTIFQEVNPAGTDPAISWAWNFEEGTGMGSPTSFQFSDSTGYTVTMSTTRKSGCIYSLAKNITIYPGPRARFTPSVLAGGAPLEVIFNNSSIADSSFWQFDDAAQTTSKAFSPTFVYSQLGEYKPLLTVKNSYDCVDTLSAVIDVVVPHIDFAMENFSLANDASSNSSKAIVTILNSGNIPLSNPEVDLDLGGGALIKQTVIGLIRPGKSIIQTLGVEIISRTLDYICAEIEVTGDVNQSNNKQCISLSNEDVILTPYPNPATTKINFDWIAAAGENVKVTIYKSNGEVAYQQNFDAVQSGLSQLVVNTSSLAAGLYLIQFDGSSTNKAFKIMIGN